MEISHEELRRRIATVEGWYRSCRLCPRDCGIDRLAGEIGFCGLGRDASIYRELLHMGEERELVPSHVVYLTGCNLRCAFCSEGAWVREPRGGDARPVDPGRLARRIARRRSEGARNVNFVGGSPDVNLLAILETLQHTARDTTVVWNSNLWVSPEALAILDGLVDIYLADLKFGDDACAASLAQAPRYVSIVRDNLRQALRLRGRVIVRHLLVPGHFDCCTRPTLEWLRAELPEATVNLMTGFVPFDRMRAPGSQAKSHAPDRSPSRSPNHDELTAAVALLRGLDFPRALLDGEPL